MAAQRFTPEPPIYTFRVRILGCMAGFAPENATEIQREIEIAANQTLADLAEAIQRAYGFDDPHLWSFFLSGKRWDTATEYTLGTDGSPLFPDDLDDEEEDEDDDEDVEDTLNAALFPLPTSVDLTALPHTQAFITDYLNGLPATMREEMRAEVRRLMPGVPNEPAALDEAFTQLFLAGAPPAVLANLEENLRDTPASERAFLLGEFQTGAITQQMLPPGLGGLFEEQEPAGWADETLIRDLPYPGKTGKKEFLFLFDYGDEWRFGVKLLRTSDTKTPRARYPRVVARRGRSPSQYPRWAYEDDDWDDAWDEEGDASQPGIATIFRLDRETGAITPQSVIIMPPKPEE